MPSNNSGNNSGSNRTLVPQAQGFLNNLRDQIASSQGVDLKNGNGANLTSRQNGSVGGEMVRQMIEQYANQHNQQMR